LEPAWQPAEANADALADGLPIEPGQRVLLLRSEVANSEVPRRLTERGALVDDVAAYRTVPREEWEADFHNRFAQGWVHAVFVASPSAAQGLVNACGTDPTLYERSAIVSIGPSTSRKIRELGLPVAAEAREQSAAGLVAALVEYWSKE